MTRTEKIKTIIIIILVVTAVVVGLKYALPYLYPMRNQLCNYAALTIKER